MNNFSYQEKIIFWAALWLRITVLGVLLWVSGEAGITGYGDAPQYVSVANNLVQGNGFTEGPYPDVLESKRPPGYPAYLAFFLKTGFPLWAAAVLQIIMSSFTPILAMRLARLIGLGNNAELLVGMLTASEPMHIFYSVPLLSDSLAALLFIWGVYHLVRFWEERGATHLFLSAGILGIMNYIRPIGIYLYLLLPLAILVGGIVLDRKQWKNHAYSAIVFGTLFFLILTPWMFRNYVRFGAFDFTSAIGQHLYVYSAAAVRGAAEGTTWKEMKQRLLSEIEPVLPEPRNISHFANRHMLRDRAKEIISAYPQEYLKLYLFSLQSFLIAGDYHELLAFHNIMDEPKGTRSFPMIFASKSISESIAAVKAFSREPYWLIAILGRVWWGGIFLLSNFGAWWLWRHTPSSRFAVLIYVFFLFYLALVTTHLVSGIVGRQRLFIHPLYFIFMAAGAGAIFNWLRHRF